MDEKIEVEVVENNNSTPESPKPKKKSKAHLVKNIVTGVLLGIMGVLIVLQLASLITANQNGGIPNLFGYQSMVVLTDSMDSEESGTWTSTGGDSVSYPAHMLPVGSGIISKKIDTSSYESVKAIINPGDVVTFYGTISGTTQIITHRFIEYDDVNSRLMLMGDNKFAANHPEGGYTYPANANIISASAVIGVVTYSSYAYGVTLQVFQSTAFKVCMIAIPLGVLLVWGVIDVIKAAKMKNEEETVGGSSPSDEEISGNGNDDDNLPKNDDK